MHCICVKLHDISIGINSRFIRIILFCYWIFSIFFLEWYLNVWYYICCLLIYYTLYYINEIFIQKYNYWWSKMRWISNIINIQRILLYLKIELFNKTQCKVLLRSTCAYHTVSEVSTNVLASVPRRICLLESGRRNSREGKRP